MVHGSFWNLRAINVFLYRIYGVNDDHDPAHGPVLDVLRRVEMLTSLVFRRLVYRVEETKSCFETFFQLVYLIASANVVFAAQVFHHALQMAHNLAKSRHLRRTSWPFEPCGTEVYRRVRLEI